MPAAGISKTRKSADECNRMDDLFAQIANNSQKSYGKDSVDERQKPEDARKATRTGFQPVG
jgi:hypothetical protein